MGITSQAVTATTHLDMGSTHAQGYGEVVGIYRKLRRTEFTPDGKGLMRGNEDTIGI